MSAETGRTDDLFRAALRRWQATGANDDAQALARVVSQGSAPPTGRDISAVAFRLPDQKYRRVSFVKAARAGRTAMGAQITKGSPVLHFSSDGSGAAARSIIVRPDEVLQLLLAEPLEKVPDLPHNWRDPNDGTTPAERWVYVKGYDNVACRRTEPHPTVRDRILSMSFQSDVDPRVMAGNPNAHPHMRVPDAIPVDDDLDRSTEEG